MPVFSVMSTLDLHERAPQHVELQLLPDDDLMDLWEQTQQAAWAMEGRGWDAGGALRYSAMLVWEMQRRLAHRPPARCFGSGSLPPEGLTDISREHPLPDQE